MNCEESRERMIDCLYGEEFDSRRCFEFFRHLEGCQECNGEYLELLETREILQTWKIADPPLPAAPPATVRVSKRIPALVDWRRLRWWPMMQKVAAGFLIAVGVLSIIQYLGYLGGPRMVVSQRQLSELVQDMIVASQVEERQLIGKALLRIKEDMDLQRRGDMREVYDYLVTLERRYTENLEENNRYLKALLNR